MALNYPVFGRNPNDITPQPYNYYGMTGWFTVPTEWYTRSNPLNPSELIVSPNSDFSPPVYYACLCQDGINYVFQDLLLSLYTGTAGNNNQ